MLWSYEARHLDERQLLANLNPAQPVIVTDQNERIVAVNRNWETMCKYTAEEAFGSTPGALLRGALTSREVATDFSLRVRGGQSAFASLLNYKKDGTMFVNHIFGYTLGDLLVAETYAEHGFEGDMKASGTVFYLGA